MPFKSQAQKAKFAELAKQGKIKQSTFDEWVSATGNSKLPERIAAKSITELRREYKRKHKGKRV